jgi:Leucine-rich repeat (LRR) protein
MIERIYCSYCKIELKNESKKRRKTQICSSCTFILNNSNYLVFTLHPELNINDIEAVKLLELKLNEILPILSTESVRDIKTKKFGIYIQDNKVIGLYLDNKDLFTYPDEINYFFHLKFLSLVNTKIKKLPESISLLTRLEVLLLQDNNIEFLPDNLAQIENLKIIDLYQNQLRLLPDSFGDLKSLVYLNVENNLLYCLPKSFISLKNLKILNVFDNQIKMDLIVNLLPKNLINCGVGGNCISNKSLRNLRNFYKKKCQVHVQRKSWLKKEFKQLNLI